LAIWTSASLISTQSREFPRTPLTPSKPRSFFRGFLFLVVSITSVSCFVQNPPPRAHSLLSMTRPQSLRHFRFPPFFDSLPNRCFYVFLSDTQRIFLLDQAHAYFSFPHSTFFMHSVFILSLPPFLACLSKRGPCTPSFEVLDFTCPKWPFVVSHTSLRTLTPPRSPFFPVPWAAY